MNEYIKIALKADPVGMVTGFRQAEGAIEKFASTFQSTMRIVDAGGQVWSRFTGAIERGGRRAMAAGAGLGITLAGNVKAAMDYQVQLKNVQSLTRASNEELAAQSQTILEMSRNLPQSAVELGAGLYDIASSGFEGAEGLQILEASAVSASAGLTQTAVASEAIVAVLNAYGKSASEAADVSDILFQGVNVGIMTFEEAASSLGTYVGMAAQAGVTIEEAVSGVATQTLSGISADSAATYLSRIIQEMLDPTEELTAAANKLGYANAKAMLDAEGLGGTLLKLNDYVNGDAVAFNALFGSIQATRGAMAIVANDGENWARVSSAIADESGRAGAAAETYAVQAETLSVKLSVFWNNVKAVAIEIGNVLVPVISFMLDLGSTILEAFAGLPSPITKAAAVIGALVSVLLLAGGAVMTFASSWVAARIAIAAVNALTTRLGMGTLIPTISSMTKRVSDLGGAFSAMGIAKTKALQGGKGLLSAIASPAGVATIGVTALAAALWNVKSNMDAARDAGRQMGEQWKEGLDTSNFQGMTKALIDTRREIKAVEQDLINLGGGPDFSGNPQWLSAFNPFDGAPEKDYAQAQAYLESLEETEKELLEKRDRLEQVISAIISTMGGEKFGAASGMNPRMFGDRFAALGRGMHDAISMWYDETLGTTDGMKEELGARLEDIAKMFGTSVEGMVYQFARIAEVEGISLDDLIEPGESGEEMARQIMNTYQAMNDLSAAGQEVELSFAAMGDEADSATTNIEKLGNALNAVLEEAFGYETAQDHLEGLVNSVFKTVDDIKTAGTLSEAMDLSSFHEDALALRAEMRDLVGGLAEETVAWAKQQKNLRPEEIEAHLQSQIDKFREYGREMGLSTEFIEHYVDALQNIVRNGEISTHFEANTDAAIAKVNGYLASLGVVPDLIPTVMEVYKEEGEATLATWLQGLGIADQVEVNNVVQLLADQAWEELSTYLNALGIAADHETIQQVIELSVSGDQEAIDTFLKNKEISQEQFELIVELLGDTDSVRRLHIVERAGKDLDDDEYKPTVSIHDKTADTYQRILDRLESLRRQTVRIPVVIDPPPGVDPNPGNFRFERKSRNAGPRPRGSTPSGGKGGGGGGGSSFADGGIRLPREAVIQSAVNGYGLVQWAEPETGGEAFIPLAPAKRARSEKILASVAEMFGGTFQKFDSGGLRGRFRPGTLSSSKESQKQQKNAEKAARDAEKAARDAEKAARDAFQRDMNVWEFKLEMGETDPATFKNVMQDKIKAFAKYSDEYMEIARKIRRAEEELREGANAANDFFYNAGIMGPLQYINHLKQRQKHVRKLSAEWWGLEEQIRNVRLEIEEGTNAAHDFYFDTGLMGADQYLAHLRKRQSRLRKFSAEWWRAEKEIAEFRKGVWEKELARQDAIFDMGDRDIAERIKFLQGVQRTVKEQSEEWFSYQKEIVDLQDTLMERRNKFGDISDDEYVTWLRQRLALTAKFSDEWERLTEEIAAIEGDAFDRATGDVFGKFQDFKVVNPETVMRYMARQIQMAERWQSTMEQLRASGAYGEGVLNRLQAAGPASAGLAEALLRAAQTGRSGKFNEMFSRAMDLGLEMGTAPAGGSMLPAGYIRPADSGGSSKTERVVTEVKVLLENPVFMDGNDATRFADRVGFVVNSLAL